MLHVLPHPGGGGETYVDVLEAMPSYRFSRIYLAHSPSPPLAQLGRGVVEAFRRARGHDVLHVHGEVAGGLCLPLLATRASVVTLHGLHLTRRLTGVRQTAAALNLRSVGRASNCTICVSNAERAELATFVGRSAALAVVIHNGVHLPNLADETERGETRRELGLTESEPVGIWVASLDERKDPLMAIRAAQRASVALLVVGDGPLRRQVERAAHGPVRVLGHRLDVPRLLAASDFFVLTSRQEGLAYSLLEAMAQGVPPVVAELPENLEAIGDAGLLFSDERALVAALRRFATTANERATLGERARQRITECFAAEEMIARTRAVYDDVFADSQPRTRPVPTAQ